MSAPEEPVSLIYQRLGRGQASAVFGAHVTVVAMRVYGCCGMVTLRLLYP